MADGKLRIKEQLMKAFIKVVAIVAIGALVGGVALVVVNHQYSNALTQYGFSQGDIGKAMTSFTGTRAYMLAAIGYSSADGVKEAQDEHDKMKEKFVNNYWPTVADTLTTQSEKDTYADLTNKINNYWTIEEQVIQKGATTDTEASLEAQKMSRDQLDPIYDEVYSQLTDLMNVNVDEGDSLSSLLDILCWVLVGVIVVAIVISIIFSTKHGSYIADGISQPLNALSDRLSAFAQGDLASPFPEVKTQDEVADMTNTAVEMGEELGIIIEDIKMILSEFSKGNYRVNSNARDRYVGDFEALLLALRDLKEQTVGTMNAIEEASTQVSAGSSNLAEASQGLAEGATEQAGVVEEMQATIEDITSNIEKAAETAEESYAQAKKYAEEADKSRDEMQIMVEAMKRITETSQQIGNIISEIEDIASQTNLLSLNASIEAARAGEAGRGFAVVADQIRQLADQSTQSAVNTRELIEKSLAEVEDGNRAAEHVAESIKEVVEGINLIADASRQISETASGQADAMQQAEAGINQISEVVQSTASIAEESSATSEELSAEADTLDGLIQKFQL